MIEQGLVEYITTGLNDASIPGGYATQLAKDTISSSTPKAWSYRGILSTPLYELDGQNALTKWHVQIDCHGYQAADSFALAHSITNVLSGGFRGVFTDADSTRVAGIYQLPSSGIDGFNDANRSFVRSLEYEIQYYAQ
jgi:hypothetical protein